jgi:hypothetical protein
LFFIGFITPAKEGVTLMSKNSLYKTILGRVAAHHMMQSRTILSCKKF